MMWLIPSLLLPWLGCSETCPTPRSELDEHDWSVFVQAVEFEIDKPEIFPVDTTPANGTHTWRIDWDSPDLVGTDPTGEVVVTIDEQPFDGKGYWSNQECGNFSITFAGEYLGGPNGENEHSFAAGALLAVFTDDVAGQPQSKLEGFLDWEETWRDASGEIGSYTAKAQVFGTLK